MGNLSELMPTCPGEKAGSLEVLAASTVGSVFLEGSGARSAGRSLVSRRGRDGAH